MLHRTSSAHALAARLSRYNLVNDMEVCDARKTLLKPDISRPIHLLRPKKSLHTSQLITQTPNLTCHRPSPFTHVPVAGYSHIARSAL